MFRYVFKRILMVIPVVLGVTIVIFTIMNIVPGDPAEILLGQVASASDIAAKRAQLGLDKPFFIRLVLYVENIFLHLNLGQSYYSSINVMDEILQRFPYTLTLALSIMMLRIIVGIPLGITAAVHQNGAGDHVSMFVTLLGISVPSFWLGIMLLLLFALKLHWLPSFGANSINAYILPVIAGSVSCISQQARQSRSSMLDVIRADYVKTARAKGLSERRILYFHVLPNALIPIITVVGNGFSSSLAGTIIIEQVFSIPGIGLYLSNSVSYRDQPAVMGCVIFLCVCLSIVMILVDIAYAYTDPRIKAQYENQSRIR
jgi:ABC-type dipeptide/oligopeptide/nickel transport system permease component